MDQNVIVVARMRAKESTINEVKELLLGLIEPSRADEGCIKYDLHQTIGDPAFFVFYEIWQSKAHLDKHAATAHFGQFQAKAPDLLAQPPEIALLTKIS